MLAQSVCERRRSSPSAYVGETGQGGMPTASPHMSLYREGCPFNPHTLSHVHTSWGLLPPPTMDLGLLLAVLRQQHISGGRAISPRGWKAAFAEPLFLDMQYLSHSPGGSSSKVPEAFYRIKRIQDRDSAFQVTSPPPDPRSLPPYPGERGVGGAACSTPRSLSADSAPHGYPWLLDAEKASQSSVESDWKQSEGARHGMGQTAPCFTQVLSR